MQWASVKEWLGRKSALVGKTVAVALLALSTAGCTTTRDDLGLHGARFRGSFTGDGGSRLDPKLCKAGVKIVDIKLVGVMVIGGDGQLCPVTVTNEGSLFLSGDGCRGSRFGVTFTVTDCITPARATMTFETTLNDGRTSRFVVEGTVRDR